VPPAGGTLGAAKGVLQAACGEVRGGKARLLSWRRGWAGSASLQSSTQGLGGGWRHGGQKGVRCLNAGALGQGGGVTYGHGEVWLPDMHPTRLQKLLVGGQTQQTMKQFMESLCVMVAPGRDEADLGTSLSLPSMQTQAGFFRPLLPDQ
jgi:hypothetical protein